MVIGTIGPSAGKLAGFRLKEPSTCSSERLEVFNLAGSDGKANPIFTEDPEVSMPSPTCRCRAEVAQKRPRPACNETTVRGEEGVMVTVPAP